MKKLHIIAFYLKLISALAEGPNLLLSTAIRINKITVLYPAGVISERDLKICQERSACNVIHKRFWFPPLVERLCRCPYRNECPWTWSSSDDGQSLYLNNRSQLKFCTDTSHLPNCTSKKAAISVATSLAPVGNHPANNYALLHDIEKPKRFSHDRNVTVSCNCREPHYWRLKNNSAKIDEESGNSHQTYYCSKLKKCGRSDFCGHVRLDTHSTFYRCSCPGGHMCMTKNKTVYQAEEILYSGDCYKAFCLQHKPN